MARNEEITQLGEPAFSFEDLELGKIAPNPGWLKEFWGRWPGDETIGELLAALDNIDKGDLMEIRNGEKC